MTDMENAVLIVFFALVSVGLIADLLLFYRVWLKRIRSLEKRVALLERGDHDET